MLGRFCLLLLLLWRKEGGGGGEVVYGDIPVFAWIPSRRMEVYNNLEP